MSEIGSQNDYDQVQEAIEKLNKSFKYKKIRQFETGANRDTDTGKLDLEGFLSPLVIEAYAHYMHFNRYLSDGSLRDSDNWQKGIPSGVYMKSLWRHFFDLWKYYRGYPIKDHVIFAGCGILFNTMGWLHEFLKENPEQIGEALSHQESLRSVQKQTV